MAIASLVTGSQLSATCCGIPRSTPHSPSPNWGTPECLSLFNIGTWGIQGPCLRPSLCLSPSYWHFCCAQPVQPWTNKRTAMGQHKVVNQKLRWEASCQSPALWDPKTFVRESQRSNKDLAGHRKKNTHTKTKLFPTLIALLTSPTPIPILV